MKSVPRGGQTPARTGPSFFSGAVAALAGIVRESRKNKWLLFMAAPGLLVLLVISYLPMFGLVIAFKKFRSDKGIWGSDWVGFDNFKFLFANNDAWHITFNTLYLNALFIATGTIAALVVAILMNEVRSKLAVKIYQSTLFFPYFLSWVIVGYFVFALLNYDNGFINRTLNALGAESVQWFGLPKDWPAILVLVSLWKTTGYTSLIYFAGIIGINPEYYEAARIDGASKWQQMTRITLPLVSHLIVIMVLLAIGRIFYADFGLFYNVTQNNPILYNTTDVIDTYVFRALRKLGDIGMASAAGFYQSVVGFVLIVVCNWLVRKFDKDRALF
ncbi:MAG: sugar ABC transporter permease [Paenibacillaceae bacterium]|nr:sugar ABC transporter permease [Paenibacillaceae bacterium]